MKRKREITSVVEGVMLALWKQGLDTYAIATHLRIEENVVYNRLLHLRQMAKGDHPGHSAAAPVTAG